MRLVNRIAMAAVCVGIGAAEVAHATDVFVPNGSFEDVPATPPVSFVEPPWVFNGLGDGGFGTGVFSNPPTGTVRSASQGGHLSNPDGTGQIVYIFGDPGNSVQQALTVGHANPSPVNFAAGTYTLSANFALAGKPPPVGQKLLLNLDYLDGTTTHVLASTVIAVPHFTQMIPDPSGSTATVPIYTPIDSDPASANYNPFGLNTDSLVPISVTGTVAPGDPAFGKQIFLSIETSSTNVGPSLADPTAGGGEFDFDGVTLNFVPEPACLSLLALPALLMLRRRDRTAPGKR